MSDVFRFDDPFYPVPSKAVEADPEGLVRELIHRAYKSECALDEDRLQAIAGRRALLLDLVSLADDVSAIVERYGVSSSAREAAIIRSVVAFGKKLFETLRQQGVETVNAIGESVDPETSDVVGSELQEGMSAGRVLREVQVGYTWPHGLLRRARVIVSASGDGSIVEAAPQRETAAPTQDIAGADIDTPSADSEGSASAGTRESQR